MRRLRRILTTALCPLLATTMLAGCGPTARATANMPEGPAITIGVAADMPGLSRFHDGSYSGFDINVATYVANQLGYAKKQIIFRSVTAANYQDKLSRRTVDFVAAPLPIGTGASSADTTYAGPYLNAKQGLLIRTADTKRITSTASLADRNVCTVTGSGAAASIQRRQPAAHIQERDTYLQCVTALLVGEADAISGDDAALAGLAANEGSAYLHVVSDTFGSSLHAISVKAGERALAAKIDTILKQMVRSETWKSFAGQMSDQLRYTPSSKLNPPSIRSDNG
ncbi:glutamate-binding protein [Bifidobacterium thermophilum]|nr:glutamate-binding protein [Bifidobacterium thermophilum]